MTTTEILKFIKDNPISLTVPLSLVAIFIAYRAYKINKTRLALDKLKIFNDFSNGFEVLKRSQDKIDKLLVKSANTINHENLTADLKKIDIILDDLNKNDEKLRGAFILPVTINGLIDYLEELKTIITNTLQSESLSTEDFHKIKSTYGFIYLQTFLMSPKALPKQYKVKEINEELGQIKFMNYYIELLLKL